VQYEAQRKGYEFEREVAAIFRTLGAKVVHEVALAGNQIDVLATEQTRSGAPVRMAIECKSYSKPVGVDVINSFASVSYLLKQRGLIDKAAVVSANGFTKQAREAARAHEIELFELADIQQRVQGSEQAVRQAELAVDSEHRELARSPSRPRRLFVVMPFLQEFDDVYILGIRDVAERLGLVVERADDIEHNGGILEVILDRIAKCDAVVADTTGRNPNVFYEIGRSHALGKPTILISRAGQDIPFDLRSVNHILYQTLVDLREKLERRLRALISENGKLPGQ